MLKCSIIEILGLKYILKIKFTYFFFNMAIRKIILHMWLALYLYWTALLLQKEWASQWNLFSFNRIFLYEIFNVYTRAQKFHL